MDKQIVIAWIDPYVQNRASSYRFGSDVTGEDGKLRGSQASLTYKEEAPALHWASKELPLSYVKKATSEQTERYFLAVKRLEEARAELKAVETDIALTGEPLDWEWLLEHGRPHTPHPTTGEIYVPIPYHSRQRLIHLRKGSRVVIAVQSSAYYEIAGKVGKIIKKKSKDVIVQFGQRQYRIPYPDLKPAQESTKQQRKDSQKSSEMLHRVTGQVNRVLFGEK